MKKYKHTDLDQRVKLIDREDFVDENGIKRLNYYSVGFFWAAIEPIIDFKSYYQEGNSGIINNNTNLCSVVAKTGYDFEISNIISINDKYFTIIKIVDLFQNKYLMLIAKEVKIDVTNI